MRFLVDMCIDVRVADWLRTIGHDAVHLRDIAPITLPDNDIFGLAREHGRTIVTGDLDFGEIAARSGHQTVSVVVFRMSSFVLARLTQRLAAVLPACDAALADGAIVLVEDARHRVRRLPITS